jgi:hypothetical protein
MYAPTCYGTVGILKPVCACPGKSLNSGDKLLSQGMMHDTCSNGPPSMILGSDQILEHLQSPALQCLMIQLVLCADALDITLVFTRMIGMAKFKITQEWRLICGEDAILGDVAFRYAREALTSMSLSFFTRGLFSSPPA